MKSIFLMKSFAAIGVSLALFSFGAHAQQTPCYLWAGGVIEGKKDRFYFSELGELAVDSSWKSLSNDKSRWWILPDDVLSKLNVAADAFFEANSLKLDKSRPRVNATCNNNPQVSSENRQSIMEHWAHLNYGKSVEVKGKWLHHEAVPKELRFETSKP